MYCCRYSQLYAFAKCFMIFDKIAHCVIVAECNKHNESMTDAVRIASEESDDSTTSNVENRIEIPISDIEKRNIVRFVLSEKYL